MFQSEVGSVLVCLDTGSPVLVDCKFGSETVDDGDSRGRLQGSAAASTTSTEEDQMKDLRLQESAADQPHHRQRISSRIKDIIVGGTAGDQPHRRERTKEGSLFARINSRINHIVGGGTADRAPTSTQRTKRICIVRGAGPRSSTSTDTRW